MTDHQTKHDEELDRGLRAGWTLVALAFAYVIAFWGVNFALNRDTPHGGWDLDDVPIVPASSIEADGYYHPVRTDHGQ